MSLGALRCNQSATHLDVCMTVNMNNSDILCGGRGNAADRRKSNGVIATQNDGHGTSRRYMRQRIADLIKTLFQVCRYRKYIPDIAQGHLFAQVNSFLIVVGCVERGDTTDPLRTEASTTAIRTATVKGNSHHSSIKLANLVDIFQVGGFKERVDTGKVGEFSTRKSRNCLVFNGTGSRETNFKTSLDFFVVFGCR